MKLVEDAKVKAESEFTAALKLAEDAKAKAESAADASVAALKLAKDEKNAALENLRAEKMKNLNLID